MSKQFTWARRANQYHQRIPLNKLTVGNSNLSGRSGAIYETWPRCPKIRLAFSCFDAPGLEEYYLDGQEEPSLQNIYNYKWPRRRRKALKFASANEFGDFSSRQRPPASRFHENFRNFGFCIWPWICKISCQNKFPGRGSQPIPPTNAPQQTDGRKLNSIGPILRNLRKRDQDARKSGSHFSCFDTPGLEEYYLHGQEDPSLQDNSHREI